MTRALFLTLTRNDNKPDNRILQLLGTVNKHQFDFGTPAYHGGYHGLMSMPYTFLGDPDKEEGALCMLAVALGQNHDISQAPH